MNRSPFEKCINSCVQSGHETITTIHCSASFSAETNCSVVSALTLEDELYSISDDHRRVYLSSLEEQAWSSDPTFASTKTCIGSTRYDRFSSCSEPKDKMLCPMPQRRLSTEFSSPSSSKQTTRQDTHKEESLEGDDWLIGNVPISSDGTLGDSRSASLDLFEVFGDRSNPERGLEDDHHQ